MEEALAFFRFATGLSGCWWSLAHNKRGKRRQGGRAWLCYRELAALAKLNLKEFRDDGGGEGWGYRVVSLNDC